MLDYLFCLLQEIIILIVDTLFQITMYLKLKSMTSIDGKGFFDLSVKNYEEACVKVIEMSNNNDYTTGNLLDNA